MYHICSIDESLSCFLLPVNGQKAKIILYEKVTEKHGQTDHCSQVPSAPRVRPSVDVNTVDY
jgi:hypothetical protein